MASGWQYRVVSVLGTMGLTVVAVLVANLTAIQEAFALIPFFGNPAPVVLSGGQVTWALGTVLTVVLATMWPLYKPRPSRILDTILLTQKRVLLSMVGMAGLGYFKWSHRLPRSTLMLTTVILLATLPILFVYIRCRPVGVSRAVIVGDSPRAMQDILAATDIPVLGYVSPPSSYLRETKANQQPIRVSDGGLLKQQLEDLTCLGGLSRLDEVFVNNDVDTALLAFAETDRGEFFGALETCHNHGLNVLSHREHADQVLIDDTAADELVEVDIRPLDWQDYLIKRTFDIAFSALGLLVLSPVIAVISLAIKLDDRGPILYSQERTAAFGNTFTVHKFRSMRPGEEISSPNSSEEYRVTRVGRVLRKMHLDEIPQLWAILVGKMSVVGPRAVWTDEETHLEKETPNWRKRWFIKPGLTGLAQINDATSTYAKAKLRYDVEYIRRQSFWFDLKIIVRQIWQVLGDVFKTVQTE